MVVRMSAQRRVALAIPLVLAGLAMFSLPGAWLFSRGAPWWAALAAAALVFPVAPVAWHLLGERARRRGLAAAAASAKPGVKPKTGTLTGGDRFTLRLLVVGLATLGPLIFFRGGQAWRALRAHPAWFVPRPPPGPRTFVGDGRLMAQVPGDAELVIWARRVDGLRGEEASKPDPEDAQEVLVAARGGELLVAVRATDKAFAKLDLAEVNAQLGKQTFFPVKGPLVSRRRTSDLMVIVSEGWASAADDRAAGRASGPAAIEARLAKAPADAVVITAAAPSRPVAGMALVGMQSWLRVSKAAIRVDADFEVTDPLVAAALVARAEEERRELVAMMPDECKAKVRGLLDDVAIVRGETSVRMRAWWDPERVGEAMMCGLGVMMKQADWK